MKKFFRFLLAAAVLSSAAISCSDDPAPEPGPGPNTGGTPEEVQTLAKTPDGISLFASEITSTDFNIRTEMGEGALTYRFDIVSRGRFYNDYMEALKTKPDMTEDEYVIYRLVRDDGTGGYGFKIPIDVQWGESIYKQAAIIPTFDYVVMAVGCLDEKGAVPSEVTTLKFRLQPRDLVGDPRAAIELKSDYRAFSATYTRNADCAAYYQLVPPKEHVDEAVAFFEKMAVEDPSLDPELLMRDVICGFSMAPITENVTIPTDFGFQATSDIKVTAMTVGLDENGTPNTKWETATIGLKELQNLEKAKYTFKFGNISATTAYTDITGEWDKTRWVCYRFFTLDEWEKADHSEIAMKNLAIEIAMNGFHQGEKSEELNQMWGLTPNTDYVVAVTAQNKEIDLLPIETFKFRTLPLIKDQPDMSKAQVKASAIDIGKSSIRVKYDIPEGTVCWWERILEKGAMDASGLDLTDPANRERVKEFILNVNEGGNDNQANAPREWTYTGFTPDMDYYHFLIGEDENGYLGHMYVAEYRTASNEGGPDPKVTLSGEVVKRSDGAYLWTVRCTVNDDVTKLRYCIHDKTYADENMTQEEKIDAWTDAVLGEQGMKTINSTRVDMVVTKYTQAVALAFPYGKNDCLGELAYLLFDPATIQSSMLKQVRPFRLAVPPSEDKIQRVPVL